jgi:ribonuclease HI
MWTDGSMQPNSKIGAWAVIIDCYGQRYELVQSCPAVSTTEMEFLAAIKGLRALDKPYAVMLYTDSMDLYNASLAIHKNVEFFHGSTAIVKRHKQVFRELAEQLERHDVMVHWIKGHARNDNNKRCDWLAKRSAIARVQRELAQRGRMEQEQKTGLVVVPQLPAAMPAVIINSAPRPMPVWTL